MEAHYALLRICSADIDEGSEKDDADAYQEAVIGQTSAAETAREDAKTEARKDRIRQAGGESGELRKDGEQHVAIPSDYPQEWADKAAAAYESAGIEMGSTKQSRGAQDEDDADSTEAQAPEKDRHGLAQTGPEKAAAAADALQGPGLQGAAGLEPDAWADPSGDGLHRSSDGSSSGTGKTLALSDVDPAELRQSLDMGGDFNVQRERFGLPQQAAHVGLTGAQVQQQLGHLPSLETESIMAETEAGGEALAEGIDAAMRGKLQVGTLLL